MITSCNYTIQKQASAPANEFVFTTGREISFSIVKSQVLDVACLSCHSVNGSRGQDRGKINLETYQNVFQNRNDIRDDIVDGSMPKNSPPLSAYQKRLILAWLDAGANEQATEELPTNPAPNPPPNPPPVAPDPVVVPDIPADQIFYPEVAKYFFEPNCVKCHKPGGKREDFTNYANIIKNRDKIIDELDQGEMPPAAPKGIPLTDAQLKLFFTWLDKGAPENAAP